MGFIALGMYVYGEPQIQPESDWLPHYTHASMATVGTTCWQVATVTHRAQS